MSELILASTSRYRRELLDRLGVPYRAVAHRVDEAEFKAEPGSPRALASNLARAKAASLAAIFPDAFILGSDQVAVLEGQILSTPGKAERACEQLRLLRGRDHALITAVALSTPSGEVLHHVDEHRLRMRYLTDDEIERYVEADAPLDCCGSYKIESRGIALFEAIEGADFTAIVGLGLIGVTKLLRRAGFRVP